MKSINMKRILLVVGSIAALAQTVNPASAADWVQGPVYNSSSTFPGATYKTVLTSKGLCFTAGSPGPFNLGKMRVTFFTPGNLGTVTFKLDLRNTTTTGSSAVAGTTLYASDTISLATPVAGGFFTNDLTAAALPNISAYAMESGASYSLSFYACSTNAFSLARWAGGGTTNYTTTSGFVVLSSL